MTPSSRWPDPESTLALLGHVWVTFTACRQPQHQGKDATLAQFAKHSTTKEHLLSCLQLFAVFVKEAFAGWPESVWFNSPCSLRF